MGARQVAHGFDVTGRPSAFYLLQLPQLGNPTVWQEPELEKVATSDLW